MGHAIIFDSIDTQQPLNIHLLLINQAIMSMNPLGYHSVFFLTSLLEYNCFTMVC